MGTRRTFCYPDSNFKVEDVELARFSIAGGVRLVVRAECGYEINYPVTETG